jgi:hypothetical protein
MKHIVVFLWGMIVASGWWGYGLYRYFDTGGLPIDIPNWFAFLFLIVLLGSIPTVLYFLVFIIHVGMKCWND